MGKRHNQSSKKSIEAAAGRKKSSPNRSSSGKKHGRSRGTFACDNADYDSPSKEHEDLQYLLIEPSGKSTKRIENPDIDALLNTAKELLRGNQPREAIEVLQRAREKGFCYEADYLLGVCFLITEQYPNAITLFRNLLKVGKKPKKNMFLLLSVCHKKLEDYANTERIVIPGLFSFRNACRNIPSSTKRTSTAANCLISSKSTGKPKATSKLQFSFTQNAR